MGLKLDPALACKADSQLDDHTFKLEEQVRAWFRRGLEIVTNLGGCGAKQDLRRRVHCSPISSKAIIMQNGNFNLVSRKLSAGSRLRLTRIIVLAGATALGNCLSGVPFDAAPFALPLPGGNGLLWEDPREIHQVIVEFAGPAPATDQVRLEYWGSRWPEQHLPKDREPGGGDVGWMELGNWYNGGWRGADTEATVDGGKIIFSFRPVEAKEFPKLKGYSAKFRYTFKLRVAGNSVSPPIRSVQAFTDSVLEPRSFVLALKQSPKSDLSVTAFNGKVGAIEKASGGRTHIRVETSVNTDPNTFDRTLVTIQNGAAKFTFAIDDLKQGALFLPAFGAAVLPEGDQRDYAAVAAAQRETGAKTLYDRVTQLPEQTWRSAWNNMPPKKSHIYFPLGLDGGRQRFQLEANGALRFRLNDHFLKARPGVDTPRFALEPAPVEVRFAPFGEPVERRLEEDTIPICQSTWKANGLTIIQTALATELGGSKANGSVPPADATTVFLARFVFTNVSATSAAAELPLKYRAGDADKTLRVDSQGLLWLGPNLRGQVVAEGNPSAIDAGLTWRWSLRPGESKTIVVKLPYTVLAGKAEQEMLSSLDFDAQKKAVAGYWRRRLNEGAQLITPEPVLNEFYRSDAGHLLINCEREPNSTRRFARVGSFSYGAYGNESCMMVVDLDRRGYHREAQECLDAWLHYQGSVELPGDFSSKAGILYGAGGYESGGYNQHHGWILWMLAEHYRFTRDDGWLRSAASGITAGADWIIRETKRTAERLPLERGLLPPGDLEDIGDWWPWLSTSCYTWRGLDAAAWALEQIHHPEAERIRREADIYHSKLLASFQSASERSPVVRLRDGTAVPQIPSQVHRRGRSFGWICETLEGAMHMLITGALDTHSPQAEWILKDYEDNLYLSNQYGYTVPEFDKYWFGRGGMSMQACLLLDVEPYLSRDDVKQALRAMFNAIAVSHFPDVHMNTEHALPEMGDWRGDHYKSSDESNACGWLRQVFVREQGEELLLGQAIPREWLKAGQRCGIQKAATYFGSMSLLYTGGDDEVTAQVDPPRRNPPKRIRVRFRMPNQHLITSVALNGKPWKGFSGEWVDLPGDAGVTEVKARY